MWDAAKRCIDRFTSSHQLRFCYREWGAKIRLPMLAALPIVQEMIFADCEKIFTNVSTL